MIVTIPHCSDDITIDLSTRVLDQSMVYQGEGFKSYTNLVDTVQSNLIIGYGGKIAKRVSECLTFLGLGCGSSIVEYTLLRDTCNKKAMYYGIDTSYEMLVESKKTLKKAKNNYLLVNTNFIEKAYVNWQISKSYNGAPIVVSLLGGTFGNINPYRTIKVIKSLIGDGMFIFDVNFLKDNNEEYFIEGMQKQADEERDFFLNGVSLLGYDISNLPLYTRFNKTELFVECEYYTFLGKLPRNKDGYLFGETELKVFSIKSFYYDKLSKLMEVNDLQVVEKIEIESANRPVCIVGVEKNEYETT